MNKNLVVLACLAALVAAVPAAASPAEAAPVAAAFLTTGAAAPSCAPAGAQPVVAFEQAAYCSATALCGDGSTVSCSCSGPSCNCNAQDVSCSANQRGYVSCNGNTTYCTACPCPPSNRCINGAPCQANCGNCGIGSCVQGKCNCDA